MTKNKGPRILITLECIECRKNPLERRANGISRYATSKNRKNNPEKLALQKYCRYCDAKTIHKEIK